MKIETKYSIDDEVWLMYSNKPMKGFIIGFLITHGCQRISERYVCKEPRYNLSLSNNSSYEAASESNLFKTKEELLASL